MCVGGHPNHWKRGLTTSECCVSKMGLIAFWAILSVSMLKTSSVGFFLAFFMKYIMPPAIARMAQAAAAAMENKS